jgi:AIG2 family protein
MLHFAYGANMHRAIMGRHAAAAEPIGAAALADHRFIITADGYASVAPALAQAVHGVLWRITPHDRVTLDAWENVAGKLYRAAILPVRHGDRLRPALVYIARRGRIGQPKAGYMELVVAAARAWQLPADYISDLQQWLPRRPMGAGARKLGDIAWT